MKKMSLLALLISFHVQAQDFVLHKKETVKKNQSLNKLKEQFGDELRATVYATSDVLKQLSNVHVDKTKAFIAVRHQKNKDSDVQGEGCPLVTLNHRDAAIVHYVGATTGLLATLHERCSHVIESLINNDKPFKKAKKDTIIQAHDVIKKAHNVLQDMNKSLKNIDTCQIKAHYIDTRQALKAIDAVECLKHA